VRDRAVGVILSSAFGLLGIGLLIFVIGFFAWPYMGRIIRGQTLLLRERESWTPPAAWVRAVHASCSASCCRTCATRSTREAAGGPTPNLVGKHSRLEAFHLMTRRGFTGLATIGAVATLALAACGGGSSSGGGGTAAGFSAAVTGVVNPSSHKGGTLSFGFSSTPDSTDPGNTYYAFMWNFTRLYTMPLMTYASCPGACGLRVVPDLATAPGTVSGNGLTWTYHIKPNVRFEDGSTVTSADVKYAVERTFDRSLFPLGPAYYPLLLGGNAKTYPGPYKDRSKNIMGLTAVQTPNATTIVFHLAHPFADFNYVAAIPQTAPVPPGKDTGANYQLHPMSTGPYKFQSYQLNKQLTLVPNTFWNPATDPNAKQLVSKITVTMNMNANDIDNRLLAGDLDVDMAGTGVQPAAQAKILSTPSLKAQSDNPVNGFLWYAYLNTVVPPMNNVHCRMAIEYAANKVNQQTAYGGPYAGSAIASTVSPPNVVGHKQFDLYDALSKPHGDPAAAREQLKLCGQPNGFSTGIAYRRDRPKEVAAATALQQALSAVGIKTTLHGYPADTYYATFAGVPRYVHQHDLGIDFGGWAPDWPDGFAFFDFITAGDTIGAAGNTNIEELNNPAVNRDLNKMALATNAAARNSYTPQIDIQVMKDAGILPEVYAKSLLYRSPQLTNVYVQPYYGMYNYAVLGLKRPARTR
jgi:peptide/nickel transport system substrate-binding protein